MRIIRTPPQLLTIINIILIRIYASKFWYLQREDEQVHVHRLSCSGCGQKGKTQFELIIFIKI